MNAPEFINLVRRMREAQKIYFDRTTRTHNAMLTSMDLEKQVDAALRAMKDAEQPKEPQLFERSISQ